MARALTPRLAVVVALVALGMLTAGALVSIRIIAANTDKLLTDRIVGIGHGFTRELTARLATAQAIVQYFSATAAAAGGEDGRHGRGGRL